jgi:RimJ/RimL family protein N-acetyltransferase
MTLDDAPAHLAGEDDLARRFLSGGTSTIETVNRWIERNLESWRTGGAVRTFGVRLADGDRLIGMIEANTLSDARRNVRNISYGLYPDARGRGFATRAVRLVVSYLEEECLAELAVVQMSPDNAASKAVAERAGFRLAGRRISADREDLLTFVRRLVPAR